MFGLLRRKKPDEGNFEAVLEELASSISAHEATLARLTGSERTLKYRLTLYAIALWVAYAAVCYLGVLGRASYVFAPLVLLPALVLFWRRAVGWWYHRQERREEAALKTLRKKQRDELERLKKKTKFDETRSLLERYDEKARVRSDGRMPGAFGSPSPSVSGSPNTTSNRARNVPQLAGTPGTPSKAGGNADASMMSPASRGWADRFADALLGDGEAASSKYALICGSCHQHNGLVLLEELATMQYVCPRCGHLNPPKGEAALAGSPDALPPPSMRLRTRSLGPAQAAARRPRHSVTGAEAHGTHLRAQSIDPTSGRSPSPLSGEAVSFPRSATTRELDAHERALRSAADNSTVEEDDDSDDGEEPSGTPMDLS